MIDLHFHCLPGIDDGPQDWDEAVALCRLAAAQGTATIVATPHVLRGPWLNEDPAERDRLLKELNDRLGGTPVVLPGSEVWFSSDLVELLEKGEAGPFVGLNRSRYFLVELSPVHREAAVDEAFHEMSVMGLVPVVAHAEREAAFWQDPRRLERLVSRGALVQVTAGSILGDFGRSAMEFSEQLLQDGLVHLVASDAHSVAERPPRLAEARERVRGLGVPGLEERLFVTNPTRVIAGGAPVLPAGLN